MTQIDLKEYLEAFECEVYKEKIKDDGIHYYMRRKDAVNKNEIEVLFPPKKGTYNKYNICHACNILRVKVPDCAADAQDALNKAKRPKEDDKGENT